jgi:hypothetical protein
MTATILLLTLAVLALALLHRARPADPFAALMGADRDRERQLAELRAMRGSRADVHLS